MYFNEYRVNENHILRLWRLVKYIVGLEVWQLFWKVKLVSLVKLGIHYFPVVMHPLNFEIIYLWSWDGKGMILYNLRIHAFSFHKEFEDDKNSVDGCILSLNRCNEYMEKICGYLIPPFQGGHNHLSFPNMFSLVRCNVSPSSSFLVNLL